MKGSTPRCAGEGPRGPAKYQHALLNFNEILEPCILEESFRLRRDPFFLWKHALWPILHFFHF